MQRREERLFAHPERGPEGIGGQRRPGVAEEREETVTQGIRGGRLIADEAGARVGDLQTQMHWRRARGGAVLDAQLEEPAPSGRENDAPPEATAAPISRGPLS